VQQYPAIHTAVLDACDTRDGVTDGVLEDPTACRFDPAVLTCKGGDANTCLTPAQVDAARRIYSPARNPRTDDEIFPGLLPGSELQWDRLAGPNPAYYATETYKYLVFSDPAPTTRPASRAHFPHPQ
jgi:feruloyl esterase